MGGQPRRSRDEPTTARGGHAAVAVPEAGGGPPGRVVIEDVVPQVDGGRFAAKRAVGQPVDVAATIFPEGHDLLAAQLRYRKAGEPGWRDVAMESLGNDRWAAQFVVDALGIYGPPYELCVGAVVPGTEEYLDSEKYEVRHWDLDQPDSLRPLATLLNRIRRENTAFRSRPPAAFLPGGQRGADRVREVDA